MAFFHEFLLGLNSFWKALVFIRTHRLYWYMLLPAALMPGIYALGAYLLKQPVAAELFTVNDIIWFVLGQLFQISVAILFMKFTKYLVVLVLSPLLTHLSQRTEKILTGKVYPFDFNQFMKDVRRALRITVRNLLWHYSLVMVVILIALAGWHTYQDAPVTVFTFVIGFYYYGFSFIDYVNERRKLSVDESVQFMRKHRGLAVAIGAVYSLMILLPLDTDVVFGLNVTKEGFLAGLGQFLLHIFLWICASAAPVITIVAATIAMNDLLKMKRNH
jgi:CysZ protein